MVIYFGWKLLVYLGVLVLVAAKIRPDDGSGDKPDDEPDDNPDIGKSPEKNYPRVDNMRGRRAGLDTFRDLLENFRSRLNQFIIVEDAERIPVLPTCPDGFHYLPKAGSCYRVIYEEHNWTSADDRCRQITPDAHLVAITTKEENEALKTFLASDLNANSHRNVCIAHDGGDEQKMLWTSGQRRNNDCKEPFVWRLSPSNDQLLSYSEWHAKEPNCEANIEKCVRIIPGLTYKWDAIDCESRNPCPVCEFDPSNN